MYDHVIFANDLNMIHEQTVSVLSHEQKPIRLAKWANGLLFCWKKKNNYFCLKMIYMIYDDFKAIHYYSYCSVITQRQECSENILELEHICL